MIRTQGKVKYPKAQLREPRSFNNTSLASLSISQTRDIISKTNCCANPIPKKEKRPMFFDHDKVIHLALYNAIQQKTDIYSIFSLFQADIDSSSSFQSVVNHKSFSARTSSHRLQSLMLQISSRNIIHCRNLIIFFIISPFLLIELINEIQNPQASSSLSSSSSYHSDVTS